MTTTMEHQAEVGQFADFAYAPNGIPEGGLPEGWVIPDGGTRIEGDFAAFAYQNTTTGEIVIAFRGSDNLGEVVVGAHP